MNRRRALGLLACLVLPLAVGCDKAAWGHKGRAGATGYEAVKSGMHEKDVVKCLGEPTRRNTIRLEGNGPPALVMTYVGHNQLITITLVDNSVVGKQKY